MNTRVVGITNVEAIPLSNNIRYTRAKDEQHIKKYDKEIELALYRHNKKNYIVKCIEQTIKRAIDILGGIIGTIILIPLTLIIAFVNFINKENGPVFYSQKRIGKDGKYFKMYKFRTMVVNADEKLKELLESDEEIKKEWNKNRKLKNDPRITKIGSVLRKTSLDEWPQFLCVLLGTMSIIGPRAVVDDEIELFGKYKKDVLSVKPGITRILGCKWKE